MKACAAISKTYSVKPLTSVVIPVYNQEKFIAEAVDSVLHQTYERIELIVVDDGSTDETPSILRGYGDSITYIRQPNRGAATALNHGIERARGELVGWLSSDDVYEREKIERQVEYFAGHPDVALVYTDFNIIDGAGRVTRVVRSPYYPDRREFIRRLILGNFVNGSSVLATRSSLLAVGMFDPQMTLHADGNMWLRLLKHAPFGHVPEVLLNYRVHAGNASNNLAAMRQLRYVYFDKIWETYRLEDLVEGGSEAAADEFRGRALVANGLYDRAWAHYRGHHGSAGDYARLAAAWLKSGTRITAARVRQAVGAG